VRAADRLGPRLRQSEGADLALLDQALHRADGLLDRHVRVDAVLVIEIDDLQAKTLQARLAGLHDVLGTAVDSLLAVGALGLAELGCDDDLVAPALERAPEQLLVVPPAIHVGRVEVVDAAVERVVDDRDRLVVVGVAVDARHRHAAKSDGGDLDGGATELALFH
jgi:hypothetical protein